MVSRPYLVRHRLYVSGRPTEKTVDACGAVAVLDLENHGESRRLGTDYWKHIYIPDGLVTLERAQLFFEAVWWTITMLDQYKTVLVPCAQGRNRSMTVAAMVLMKYDGLSGAEAIERVREVRPSALYNQHQVDFILGVK